ncbi:chlorohydrolase [Streptococcus pneumoniae]|nr:chlorohydrolase [Streptococcus pneumoniae]
MKIKDQTRKLAEVSSKHGFEVVDGLTKSGSKYCFEVVDRTAKSAQNMVLRLRID